MPCIIFVRDRARLNQEEIYTREGRAKEKNTNLHKKIKRQSVHVKMTMEEVNHEFVTHPNL